MNLHPRLERELKTINCMLEIYCSKNCTSGQGQPLCDECTAILSYAEKRLQHCPFSNSKPTCANCTIHCYNKKMQEKTRNVMRFSGPKMIFYHPILAIRHLMDGFKNKTETVLNDNITQNRRKP